MTLGNNATVDEHADNGVPAGRLLIIGGGEDRCCGAGVLERFVELSGGDQARITLVTTATGIPDEVHAEYEQVFRKLGVGQTRELRLRGRADADSDTAAAALRDSTGVFFSGGDQSRILALVGSRTNDILREQLGHGLVVAGTSAGATALALAAPSDPVLLTYEKLDPVRDLLAGLGATGWPA